MAYTFKELKHMTVAQLREIAAGMEHEAVQGHTQMTKEHLVNALCTALGIDTFEHHEVKGVDKTNIKSEIKSLKQERDQAIAAHNAQELQAVRKKIRRLKKKLRKAMV